MKTPLWKPSEKRIKNANITRFIEYVNEKARERFSNLRGSIPMVH